MQKCLLCQLEKPNRAFAPGRASCRECLQATRAKSRARIEPLEVARIGTFAGTELTVSQWKSLIRYGLGIAKSRGYRMMRGSDDREELYSLVCEFIADALKTYKPSKGDLGEYLKRKLQNKFRAYSRSILRRRRRETAVAHRNIDRSIDRRGGEWAKMRAALERPEEIAVARTPQPWQMVDELNTDWLYEQLQTGRIKNRRKLLRDHGVDLSLISKARRHCTKGRCYCGYCEHDPAKRATMLAERYFYENPHDGGIFTDLRSLDIRKAS